MFRRKGCAGLCWKIFCYISCSCLPTRKIGAHCVDVGNALKNDVVQAGLVFDVVLFLPVSQPLNVTLHTKTRLIKHGNLGETGFQKGFKLPKPGL